MSDPLTLEALLPTDNVLSNPTTIEVAGLCGGLLVVDITGVHHAWIKRDVVFDWLEPVSRIGVVPYCILCGLFTDLQGVVTIFGSNFALSNGN